MSDFYNRLQSTALKLISDKGAPCVIRSAPISGGFDEITGQMLDDIPSTTQQGVCVVLNYGDSLVNQPESLIQQGDKKLLLSAKGVTLDSLNGKIEALGAIYTVIAAKDLNPAGITLVYEVHGRE